MTLKTIIADESGPNQIANAIRRDGVAVIEGLIGADTLADMKKCFVTRLNNLRWNDHEGYFKHDQFRRMVPDVLTLHQGFLDLALHPLVTDAVREYVGVQFQLTEAKGWRSMPTRVDFHGWHHDRWYDESLVQSRPLELKLALYLTDVDSGAFAYIAGSHREENFSDSRNDDHANASYAKATLINGLAGTCILFDTAGIHRQSHPILVQRDAVFYNYHDGATPIQQQDLSYYRYHPLLLNAAFLGNLNTESQRILGFGDSRRYQSAFVRSKNEKIASTLISALYDAILFGRRGVNVSRRALRKFMKIVRT